LLVELLSILGDGMHISKKYFSSGSHMD